MALNMRIREKWGHFFVTIPTLTIMCLGGIYDNNLLCLVGFILWIINILLASRLYNLIFYDANTTCGFYAGKAALENGFDPKAQNGILWDPNNYKISDIYKMYPNNRTVKPQAGTAGFVFYTNKNGTYSRYMEFYDYRYGGDTYTRYKFFMDSIGTQDKIFIREAKISDGKPYKRFVPLDAF